MIPKHLADNFNYYSMTLHIKGKEGSGAGVTKF